MKTIDNDIKNSEFKKIYLLFGEEAYLKNQYKNKLLSATVNGGDDMNFSSFEGKDINAKEIIDLAETLPFFADRRVILIEDSGFFKNACDDLAEYLAEVPDSTLFIFVEKEVDKRSKMYKAVGKNGKAVEFARQTEETLRTWILMRLKKEGKVIAGNAYEAFIEKTGTDMENISSELEKLVCYCMDKNEITISDVNAITTEQTQSKIFAMVDAICSRNQKQALDLYYDLLALKEPPMRIMFLITRQFRILTNVKLMSGSRFSNKDIASKVGCPEFAVRKYQAQAKVYSLDKLKQAVIDGVEFEESVKMGRLNERMAVEMFIIAYSA